MAQDGEGVQATPCESTKLVSFFAKQRRCHRASRSLRLCSLLGKDVPKVGTRRRPIMMELKITLSVQTIVKPTALGPVANTDTKLLIDDLFQKGRVLAQDAVRFTPPTCHALSWQTVVYRHFWP